VLKNPFRTGDKVLASRLENGEDHEPGTVIDAYELLIGAESKPMVVVEFEDGERRYLIGGAPNVLPAPAAEQETAGEEAADGEAEGAPAEAEPETVDVEDAGGTAPQSPEPGEG